MDVQIIKLHAFDASFSDLFAPHKTSFLNIFRNSYATYYGDDYQLRRIVDGKCTLYLATLDSLLVGASYIKHNCRRGGTAIYPEEYRRLGVAESLASASLVDFPHQYTMLSVTNHKMIGLMMKLGFKIATSIEEIQLIAKDDVEQLGHFEICDQHLVFRRYGDSASDPERPTNNAPYLQMTETNLDILTKSTGALALIVAAAGGALVGMYGQLRVRRFEHQLQTREEEKTRTVEVLSSIVEVYIRIRQEVRSHT